MKNRYYYLFLLAGMYSTYIFYSLSNVEHNILNGALEGFIIAYLVVIGKAASIIYCCNVFKKYTFIEISEILFGRVIGRVIMYIYILILFQLSFIMFKGLTHVARQYMLPTTSLLVIAIFLTTIPVTALMNDDKSFLRLISYFSVSMLLYSIIDIALEVKNVKMDYVLGTITHSLRIPSVTTIATAAFFHTGLAGVVYFNPQFNKLSFKNTFLLITFVGMPFMLAGILIPAGIWGPYAVRYLALALPDTFDTIYIDLFFIERALFVLLPLLFLFGATQMLIYLYAGYGLLKRAVKKEATAKKIITLVIIYFVAMSYLIRRTEFVEKMEIYSVTTYFLVSIVLNILYPVATKIKKKRGKL